MPARPKTLSAAIDRFASARDWEQFHTPKNLAMAVAVEAAEILEIFQWLTAEQSVRLDRRRRAHLADELADTYILLLRLASVSGIDLQRAARRKLVKNGRKYPVHKSRGTAKKYSEL